VNLVFQWSGSVGCGEGNLERSGSTALFRKRICKKEKKRGEGGRVIAVGQSRRLLKEYFGKVL